MLHSSLYTVGCSLLLQQLLHKYRFALEPFDLAGDACVARCIIFCVKEVCLSAGSSQADLIYLENWSWIPLGPLYFGKMHLAILHARAVLPTKETPLVIVICHVY